MKTPIFKSLIVLALLFFCLNYQVLSQNIGINGTGTNANASALLDIDDSGNNNKGLLIPRIPLTAINVASPVVSPATSLLVYNTALASSGATAVSPGYYYWDGTQWVRFAYNPSGTSANAWNLVGNFGTTSTTNFLGTTDNVDLVFKTNNTEKVRVLSNGRVGIGTPNPTALLEVAGVYSLFGGQTIVGNNDEVLHLSSGSSTNASFTRFGYWNGFINTGIYDVGLKGNQSFMIRNVGSGSEDISKSIYLTPFGNVGIGTTAPATKLSIVAPSAGSGFQLQDGSEGLGKKLTSDATGKASWSDPTDNTYDLYSSFVGPVATTTSIVGNGIILPKGVYFVQPYNLLQGITFSASYYGTIDATSTSGTIISGFINRELNALGTSVEQYYTMPGFIVKVTSPTATVAIRIYHGNGGTISLSTASMGLSGYFTKIN